MPHFDTGQVHMAYLSILNDLTSLACQLRYLGHLILFSFGNVTNNFFQKAVKKGKV